MKLDFEELEVVGITVRAGHTVANNCKQYQWKEKDVIDDDMSKISALIVDDTSFNKKTFMNV